MESKLYVLNENDLKSGVWNKLKLYAEARIRTLQKLLETDLGEAKTANTRGRIAELRKMLATGEERPVVKHPKANYD